MTNVLVVNSVVLRSIRYNQQQFYLVRCNALALTSHRFLWNTLTVFMLKPYLIYMDYT